VPGSAEFSLAVPHARRSPAPFDRVEIHCSDDGIRSKVLDNGCGRTCRTQLATGRQGPANSAMRLGILAAACRPAQGMTTMANMTTVGGQGTRPGQGFRSVEAILSGLGF
jgi:hypothetical protein